MQGAQMVVCRFDDVSLFYLIIIYIANKTLMCITNNVIGSGIWTNLDSGFKKFSYYSDSYEQKKNRQINSMRGLLLESW